MKQLADFSAHSGFKDGRNSKCKACKEVIRKAGVASGTYKAHAPYDYSKQLKSRYGLTLQEYDDMLLACKGKCQICGEERPLNVDHCHDTGKVRGLLCTRCNTGLGKFGNKGERLHAALAYLDGKPTGS